jgi:glycosyltransferase involved in cell wall biosynthesis
MNTPDTLEHVCFNLPDLGGGGAEKFALKLAGELQRRGARVDFLLSLRRGELLNEVPLGARVFELGGFAFRRKFGPLCRYLVRHRPQAFISNMDISNVGGLARRVTGVPTRAVMVLHGPLSETVRLESARRRRLFHIAKRLYRLADDVVAVSEGVAADAAALVPSIRDRLRVIPNPVVSEELLAAAREPVGHPWLHPGGPPVVLGVGRLHPLKDFPTLLRAFRAVRDRRPARLIILGNGDLRGQLEAEVDRLGLQGDVALPGFVRNPWAWMAKASVFCLSSISEGLPTVIIEALAVGTPVVATDCPHGPREILAGGRYGRLVPVGAADQLAAALLATLDEPRPSEVLAARGAEFSVARSADAYTALIMHGLRGGSRATAPYRAPAARVVGAR